MKILLLVKPFGEKLAKHKGKFDFFKALEKIAEVQYWGEDGHIQYILKQLNFEPDFILHYDIAWGYAFAPKIEGLQTVDIPKGCFISDVHYNKNIRKQYIDSSKIDLILSGPKYPFLREYPEYEDKFRCLPWSINPDVFKDWGMGKDINFLLMGQVYHPRKSMNKSNTQKGRYPFREAVLSKMYRVKGFVFHPHPGHRVAPSNDLLVDKKYAQELNRAKMFFTCGSVLQYPVLKFYEAPACRTLLLAESNKEIEELGFKDRVHYVSCNRGNFYEKAMYYLKNEQERKRITDEGYKFVQSHHTNDVRAKELLGFIEEILHTK
ncbi:glycosyltransferase [Halobacillus yeomjeoni]|uniref:glycosyltransferase family protein n=1 Tax=Halobacillus yeomjeoni TaxID=311194 RepID=UPI001CD62388|nr:glycosyltransferase [Halobacillus yeomjeoni]MCA0984941.1 glycosyltransferase [Halobacillus yeomjeoni]